MKVKLSVYERAINALMSSHAKLADELESEVRRSMKDAQDSKKLAERCTQLAHELENRTPFFELADERERSYWLKLPRAMRERLAGALCNPTLLEDRRAKNGAHWAAKKSLRYFEVRDRDTNVSIVRDSAQAVAEFLGVDAVELEAFFNSPPMSYLDKVPTFRVDVFEVIEVKP